MLAEETKANAPRIVDCGTELHASLRQWLSALQLCCLRSFNPQPHIDLCLSFLPRPLRLQFMPLPFQR